ncbi:hypothetical protein ASF00_07085 [Sphingomonas sp. Leaf34]|nr:hypothetical protein ASF00_07085 [Sphingomonas sp. Leaf34]KQN32917.1 hypothetical protein ASE88_02875 [Sphingomonas sp. Leaf38]
MAADDEVIATIAPITVTIYNARIDTPPVLSSNPGSPAFDPTWTTCACQPVSPAVVIVAAPTTKS